MYLVIDNSGNDQITYYYQEDKEWKKWVYPENYEDALLSSLALLLKNLKKTAQDITGLAIRVGAGRFTATRIAVTTANTLAYALQIPVTTFEELDLDAISAKLAEATPGQYVAAEYSAPASVGGQR